MFSTKRGAAIPASIVLSLLAVAIVMCIAGAGYAAGTDCIGQIKTMDIGTPVSLTGKVVTGVFSEFFYIQDTEPGHVSCGIMVKGGDASPSMRDVVSLNGTLAADAGTGEMCIDASSVTTTGVAPLPNALGRTNRSVGTTGINTTGVLQTTWGKASATLTGQSMVIDDGSGAPVKVVGPVYGIMDGNFARVTGIAGLEEGGSAKVLRIRSAADAVGLGTSPVVLTEPLIDIDASGLPDGQMSFWHNSGTLGGFFGPDSTSPTVESIDGRRCVTFDGSDRMRATFTAPSGITGSGDYTVSYWAYKTSLWPEVPVLSWAARNGAVGSAAQFNFGNSLTSGAAKHGSDLLDMPFGVFQPPANNWTHVAVTYDGTVEKSYINGVLSAQETKALAIAPDQRVYLGCGFGFDGSSYLPEVNIQGSIAGMKVYDYALSDSQVNSLYTGAIESRTISGTVKNDLQSFALINARVYVARTTPASANPAYYTTTDSLGNFSVTVPAGTWRVMAAAMGYHNSPEVVVDVTNSDAANISFGMPKTPGAEVVKIDSEELPFGPLTSLTNLGTQQGGFTSEGTAPVVELVDSVPAITFSGDGWLKSDFAMPLHTTGNLDWTICAWVYNSGFDPEETVFSWAKSDGPDGTGAKFNFGNSTTAGVMDHGGSFSTGFVGGQPSAGEWHHVAVSYYLGRQKVYVDGVLRSTITKTANVGFGGPVLLGAGYSFDGSTYYPETLFTGSLTRLSVFDRELTSSAIATLALAHPKKVAVMPLGDSITDGYQIPGGYRIKLWANVVNGGKHIDFVGSGQNGPTSLPDKDHEGHPGWTCTNLINNIDSWMDASNPRIVLLHICTNDIYFGADAATCISRLSTLIDKICVKLPANGKIYVAQIIPWGTAYPGLDDVVKQFNAMIPGLAADKIAEGKQVYVVNMYGDATNPNGLFQADLADGVHPNQGGYDKMADIWWNAIQNDLR